MALNLPTVPIANRVGFVPDFQLSPEEVEAGQQSYQDYIADIRRDAVYLRRAEEKEGQSYLMLKGNNFRVVFDHFILASYQKTVEEVVMPNYTRGQAIIETFGRRIKQVTVEIDLIESSTSLRLEGNNLRGYVGQGVRAFTELYDTHFRGSRAVKKDALVILSVKGRHTIGYVTSLAFERNSSNDHHVRAAINIWIPDEIESIVGANLAKILIDNAATARIPSRDNPGNGQVPEEVNLGNLPLRVDYGSRFTEDGPDQNKSTILVYDRFGHLILNFDNMYVTQVADMDSEKVQYEVTSPSVTKAWFYDRHLKALSISSVMFDLVQQDGTTVPQGQLELFEYLYDHYLRAPQVAHHRYRVELFVRGHQYTGFISNYSLGLASDDDNVGAVSFTFMVLDENPLGPRLPHVVVPGSDIDWGPATFSRETVEELDRQGEIPYEPVYTLDPGSTSDVVLRTNTE